MSLEVKVDVAGQIKLFKTVTFTDPYAFVDEALQNSQRAKAKTVNVTVEADRIIFEDDGIGLTDPESLFTMSKTGWDQETVEEQSPFGLGFFSCVALANKIRVESNEFYYVFDIEKLLTTRDASIESGKLEDVEGIDYTEVKGFRCSLFDLVDNFDKGKFIAKIKKVAEFITEFETYVNGTKVEAMDYTKTDGSTFAYVIDVPGLKGWIRPVKRYYESTTPSDLELYHQNRFVKNFGMEGVVGRILVGRGELDFKAPDRRDIIENERVPEFEKRLKTHIKRMLQVIVAQGTDEDIEKYQEILDKYLTIDDYKEAMRYWIITDQDKVRKLDDMSESDLRWLSVSDMRRLLGLDKIEEPESPKEFEIEGEVYKAAFGKSGEHPINSGSSGGYYGGGGYSSDTISTSDVPKIIQNRPGENLEALNQHKLLYNIEPKDLKTQAKRIYQALTHHIPIVLVKNRLEIKVLKTVENAKYLGTLDHKTVYKAKLRAPGPKDDREKRANRLFKLLSEIAGFPTNIFRIGSIDCIREVKFGDFVVESEKESAGIIRYGKVIFIDRKLIKKSRISEEYTSDLQNGDLFFIMEHMEDLSDYLYQAILEDRDKREKSAKHPEVADEHFEVAEDDYILTYREHLPRTLSKEAITYHLLGMLANNKVYDWMERE
jgi:hypothetical protein